MRREGDDVMGKKLTTKQAADRAGVHRTTIYRAAESGKLRSTTTPGGHLRIDEDDLKALGASKAQKNVRK